MEMIQSEIAIEFYNCFIYKISCIKSVTEKNNILSEMEESFRKAVRNKPSIRDEISRVYQELKIKCEEAIA